MYTIITAALGWIFRSLLLKTTFVGILFSVVILLGEYVINQLGPYLSGSAVVNSLVNIPPGIWYFLDLIMFTSGMSLVMAAVVTRFIIRRLPIVG